MGTRLTVLGAVATLVLFAACSNPLDPATKLRPSLDVVSDTIWVDPDSEPPPPPDEEDGECHVTVGWGRK